MTEIYKIMLSFVDKYLVFVVFAYFSVIIASSLCNAIVHIAVLIMIVPFHFE